MKVRRKLSRFPNYSKKYTWEMHPVYEMNWLCVSIFINIFETVTNEEMFMNAKWLRKNYTGVWR